MKKLLLCAVLLGLGALLYRAPSMVESSIPSIYYITPSQKTYKTVINCTGTIQPVSVREIYLDCAIVPAEVLVEVGDSVETGDILATVNMERTAEFAAQPLQILQQMLFGANGMPSADGADITALLALYGIEYASVAGLLDGLAGAPTASDITASWVSGSEIPRNITVPVAGIITQLELRPQVPAAVGKAVVTIAQTGGYKAVVSVAEADIASIAVGDTATLRGVGFGGSSYTGTVSKIYPTARTALLGTSRETVVDVEILLDTADEKLKPGLTTKAEIQGGENYNLITVPYEAIRQDENNQEYVFVYQEGKLQKRPVMTGRELTSEVEVLSGLETNSVVIYNPSDLVKEGAMIQIKGRADVH